MKAPGSSVSLAEARALLLAAMERAELELGDAFYAMTLEDQKRVLSMREPGLLEEIGVGLPEERVC